MKSIILPQSLLSIEGGFYGCSALKSLYIPKNVSKIEGPGFFSGCISLDSIIVDSENTTYDSRGNALIETTSNKLIAGFQKSHIIEGIQEIGEAAFAGTLLPQIALPQSVVRLHERSWVRCEFCTSITVDEKNPVFDSRTHCNAIIETATHKLIKGCPQTTFTEDITEIGAYAFCDVHLPHLFAIPEGIQKIGENAFAHCKGLATVILPASVKEIGQYAFYGSSIEQVYWKGNVERIESHTFGQCHELYSITLPCGLKSIGYAAFMDCANLRYVSLPSSLEHIHKDAFYGSPCDKFIKHNKQRLISEKVYPNK